MTNSLSRRALLATTIIASCAYAAPAYAQDETPAQATPSEAVVPATAEETEEGDTPEEIVVTGSRIARPNLDASVPVLSVTDEQIEAQGSENIADVAQTLPQFAPSFGGGRTSSSFSGTAAFGLNAANLRNLGGLRTVTLINGRRVPGGTHTSTTVDFNTIPTANIERLEVITGGQSAVYGADAVSGVVNIITKSRFRGMELGASYGIAEEGHNENPSLYALLGADLGDGGHALITAQYTYEGEVRCRDVWICNTDIRYTSPTEGPVRAPSVGTGTVAPFSGVVPGGNFFIGSGQFTIDPANGQLIPFAASIPATFNRLGYNRNPERTLAIPTRRIMLAAEASYPIADMAEAFIELNYGSSHTKGPIEPIAFQTAQQTFGTGPNAVAVTLPVTNPFFLANTTAAQRATLTAGQTTGGIAFGVRMPTPRGSDNRRNTIRAVAGLRGDYSLMGSPWNWEAYYVYGRTETKLDTLGLYGTDRLFYALRVEPIPGGGGFRCADAGARAQGCVPYNPFVSLNLQPEANNYLQLRAGQGGISELNNAVVYTSGELFQLPYGGLRVAVGGEIRAFSGFQDIDEPIRLGLTTSNALNPTAYAKTKTHELFGEVVVPLLKDMPFVNNLELEGAYRHTNSNRSPSYDTWKYGGVYEPMRGIRFRAVRAKAVRAPTPGELGGGGQTFGSVTDPCADVAGSLRRTNATVAANCLADGVPAGYDPPLVVTQGTGGLFGGNPNLLPEEAKTLTFGVVLTPAFLPGFSLTVDRFAIDIEGFVNTVGRQTKANLCYTTTDRQFCNDIFRGFRPEINANYALVAINDQLLNISTFELRGIDAEARYNLPFGLGLAANERIALQVVGTYYDRAEQTEPTGVVTKLDGAAGGDTSTQGYLRWQANGNINYSNDLINFNWNIRYIPKTRASHLPTHAAFPLIPDAWYHNMRLGFDIAQRMEFFLGVNNLMDRRPPIFPDNSTGSQAQNTISGFYDVFGRSYYAGAKVRF